MGVIFSENMIEFPPGSLDADEHISISNSVIRLSAQNAKKLLNCYMRYQYPPMIDYIALCSLFENALHGVEDTNETMKRIAVLWKLYQSQSVCYVHEVMAGVILTCDATWIERVSMLFDLFKGFGCDYMTYEDIVVSSGITGTSILKIMMQAESIREGELNTLCENLADDAYTKLSKELEQGCSRLDISKWAQERFKESKSIASPEALYKIYTSQYL